MKKIFFSILLFFTYINSSFAWDGWVTGLPASQLKKGDITIDDIPNIIVNATDFFIWIAGTVAVMKKYYFICSFRFCYCSFGLFYN